MVFTVVYEFYCTYCFFATQCSMPGETVTSLLRLWETELRAPTRIDLHISWSAVTCCEWNAHSSVWVVVVMRVCCRLIYGFVQHFSGRIIIMWTRFGFKTWCHHVIHKNTTTSGLLLNADKNAQNRCRISGRKSALHWWQKNTFRHPYVEPLGAVRFPLIFVRVRTVLQTIQRVT